MQQFVPWALAGILVASAAGCASRGTIYRDPDFRYAADARTPEWLARRGFADGTDFEATRTVAPGIGQRFRASADGPLTINSVAIDMSRSDLALEAEKGLEALTRRETLPAMAERLADPGARPIVMMNADFWGSDSMPINLFVDEGIIWRSPWTDGGDARRSVFAWDDEGHRTIGLPKFDAALVGPGGERLVIDAINVQEDGAIVTAYTWPAEDLIPQDGSLHAATLHLAGGEWLPNAPVTVRSAAAMRFIRHEPRSFVHLRSTEPLPDWIESAPEITLTATLANLPGKVVGCVGGGPMLVDEGRNVAEEATEREKMGRAFLTTKHPRSAMGLKDDGSTMVFVTVDGRQPGRSAGIDLVDLADLMRAEGCNAAMNFDGGGSTTLLVRGEVANFPSDGGGPRSVTNALVVRRTAPLGKLARIEIEPQHVRAASGSLLPLCLRGYDAGGEPVELDGRRVEWSVEGNGRIRDGMFEAGSGAGDARITARVGDFAATELLTTEEATEVAFVPDVLLLRKGDAGTVRLQARDSEGRPLAGVIPVFDIQAPDCVSVLPAGSPLGPRAGLLPATFEAKTAGTGRIVADALGRRVECGVAVDVVTGDIAHGFESLASDDMPSWIKGVVYNPDATTVVLETENVKEGAAAWRFHYGMEHGGTTKIELPLDATLPGDPVGVGLWVFGDGNKQWLRGELRDAEGKGYYLNFTGSGDGIDWLNEWRFAMVSAHDFIPMAGHGSAPKPPFVLKSVYVAQQQEAAKTDGMILLDGLTAVRRP